MLILRGLFNDVLNKVKLLGDKLFYVNNIKILFNLVILIEKLKKLIELFYIIKDYDDKII